jgi:hypothetical protein
MSQIPPAFPDRLAQMIKGAANTVRLHAQQIVTLQSGYASLAPGSWESLTLVAGWSNLSGYIPAQVRIQQAGLAYIVGHIAGGTTSNGTVIATLDAGFFNPVHSHSFTANVMAGAASVNVSVSGDADSSGLDNPNVSGFSDTAHLPDGTTEGNSASASGSGSHSHGAGSYTLTNGAHWHGAGSLDGSLAVANSNHQHGTSSITTPINYNTVTLTINTSGQLIVTNCNSSATQLSFAEHLPLVTS